MTQELWPECKKAEISLALLQTPPPPHHHKWVTTYNFDFLCLLYKTFHNSKNGQQDLVQNSNFWRNEGDRVEEAKLGHCRVRCRCQRIDFKTKNIGVWGHGGAGRCRCQRSCRRALFNSPLFAAIQASDQNSESMSLVSRTLPHLDKINKSTVS